MKKKLTPRNPFVALAKFRKAGFHTKQTKSLRRQDKQVLAKTVKQSPESWQKCISAESTFAMTSVGPFFVSLVQFERGCFVRKLADLTRRITGPAMRRVLSLPAISLGIPRVRKHAGKCQVGGYAEFSGF